jgi:hypothetical protein
VFAAVSPTHEEVRWNGDDDEGEHAAGAFGVVMDGGDEKDQ